MSHPFPTLAVILLASLAARPAPATADCQRLELTDVSVSVAPGVDLFVREGGKGDPAVIVPGGFLVEDRLCALAERHRVVFYDMRNRGRSSPVTEGSRLTLGADLADLEAIRQHFGVERTALIGYSYLGKMVVLYARRNPGRVSRIVQLGPVPMDPGRTFPENLAEPPLTATGAYDETIREIRARRAEGLHESDPATYCELEWALQRQGLVGDPARAERIPSRCHLPNEWPTRLVFHMQHHFRGSMLGSVVTPLDLVDLQIPVLTLHGTRDRNAPYGGGREWAASLPGARLLTMEGMAHALHHETDLVPILETFLAGRWPAGVEDVEAGADGQRSQLQAWDLLRKASELHGTEKVPEAEALSMRWRGALYPRSQGRSVEPPIGPPFPGRWRALLATDGQRLVFEEEVDQPAFTSRFRSVVRPDDAFDLDLVTGRVSPPWRPPDELLAGMIRRVPAMLLAEVLEEAPGALRFAGVERLDGRPLQVVAAVHRGERLDLFLDGESRLVAWGRMSSEPMLGDTYATVRLAGASQETGLALPETIREVVDGIGTTFDVELVGASWGDIEPTSLRRPRTGEQPEPAPATGDEVSEITALDRGVFLVPVPGGPDYRSLVVERPDHLVLVEAPVGERATGEMLATIEERFPDKPIRWVVASHHHFDHSGGVPRALRDGAMLVTTPGNVAFFRRAVTGPYTIDRQEGLGEPPTIRPVADTWSVPGGPPSVEVVRVEANEHAAEMLAVHVPRAKLLFQADLVRFPLDTERERPQVESLRRLLREKVPGAERIAGVHGEVGQVEELLD